MRARWGPASTICSGGWPPRSPIRPAAARTCRGPPRSCARPSTRTSTIARATRCRCCTRSSATRSRSSEREILAAYGARDPWQLVDHLSRLELGGTRDVARHQALAASGAVILGWLADDADGVTEEVVDAAEAWLAAAMTS
jgi:hypothetical protein